MNDDLAFIKVIAVCKGFSSCPSLHHLWSHEFTSRSRPCRYLTQRTAYGQVSFFPRGITSQNIRLLVQLDWLMQLCRFLTGPPDMDKQLCPAQVPVPTIFRKLPNSEYQKIHVVLYRALRLTFCLLIDGQFLFEAIYSEHYFTIVFNALNFVSFWIYTFFASNYRKVCTQKGILHHLW